MTEVLVEEGLMIMVMGIVFVMAFLCILVFAVNIMSKVITYLNKLFPEAVYVVGKPPKKGNDDEAVAVALAAIMSKS